jgi:hypothetical protein
VPRTCSVCLHSAREEIEKSLVAHRSLRQIASRFGLEKDALANHKQEHLPESIVAVATARQKKHSQTLVDRIERVIERTETILDRAEEGGRDHTSISAIRELRQSIELLGKATGELRETPSAVINVFEAPVIQGILGVFDKLRPHVPKEVWVETAEEIAGLKELEK